MVSHSFVISHTFVIVLWKCPAHIVARVDENSFLLAIQPKLVDLILCKGMLRFFISREQTRPFSLTDFYFRLMETTKAEKNKYKTPKSEHCVCDWRIGNWRGSGSGRGLAGLLLKDAARRKLFSIDFYCTFTKGRRGLLQGSTEKCLVSLGEWGSWQAWHGAIKKLHVLHWDRRILEIPNLFFFTATTTATEKEKQKNHICLQSRLTLHCI